MVGYCANLPAMAYEMTTLAALKSRILSFNKSEIADRRRVSRRDVILFALVGIPSAVAAAIFLVLKATDLPLIDRKSVVSGKSVSVRVDLGGRRIIKKKKKTQQKEQ